MPREDNAALASQIPSSMVRRIAQGVRYAVAGVVPNDWFGPSQPITPQAPGIVAGRQFDYPVGYNLNIQPRSEEQIGFNQLRGLSEAFDVLRLVIETRKDQIEALPWTLQNRAGAVVDPATIGDIRRFLQCPDREHGWTQWLRLLLEDLMVLDAPTLYLRRTLAGEPYALEVIDGATIKRVLDERGRTPVAPDVAYQQVLKGMPAVDYSAEELLYLPRNPRPHKVYGMSPVEQIVMTVNIALRRQVSLLNYYTEGNTPEALIGVPDDWSPDQISQFQSYWDSLLEGNLAARRHTKFVPGGLKYQPLREPALKDEFDEWLARIVCYAFSLPPTPFVKQSNRATAEAQQDAALSEGLVPLQQWVKQMIDRLLADYWNAPGLEFVWIGGAMQDPLVQAQVNQIYLATGVKTVAEVRAELGIGGNGQSQKVLGKAGYDADQPRDDQGMWTGGDDYEKAWTEQPKLQLRTGLAAKEKSDKGNGKYGYDAVHEGANRALGRYQLKDSSLVANGLKRDFGENGWGNTAFAKEYNIKTDKDFLSNPDAQEAALNTYLDDLDKTKWLPDYEGKSYEGIQGEQITVTKSGLIAAMHRSGPSAVKSYLKKWSNTGSYGHTLSGSEKTIETRLRQFQNIPYN